jgi:2-O-methyltransferase
VRNIQELSVLAGIVIGICGIAQICRRLDFQQLIVRLRAFLGISYMSGCAPDFGRLITKAEISSLIAIPNPLIVEIGSHYAEDAVEIMCEMPGARLYCFEADPRCIARSRQRLAHFPQATLIEMAVSNIDGEVTWYQSGSRDPTSDWDQSSSLCLPKDHLVIYPTITFDRRITVPSISLDTWASQALQGLIDFVWMDVQGAERQVFLGATRVLRSIKWIYSEYYDVEMYEGQMSLNEMRDVLADFELAGLYCGNALFRNRKL